MMTIEHDEEAEKRRSNRYSASWPVVFGGGKGRVRDISASGVFFEAKRSVPVARAERVVVAVGATKAKRHSVVDDCLRFEGKVVRAQMLENGRYGIAVEFEQAHFCGPTPLDELGRHLQGS